MRDRALMGARSVLGVVLLTWASTAFATPFTYNGTTVGGPTWNRPVAGNPPTSPPSGVGTAVRFDVFDFMVTLPGTVTFQSTATSPAAWDNYTFLYQNSFNPGAQFTNVLIGNDDNPTIGLSGFSFNLNAGQHYFLITTGFANTDAGAFSTLITPANVDANIVPQAQAAVPEPASMVLLGTGLVAVARRRFKSRK